MKKTNAGLLAISLLMTTAAPTFAAPPVGRLLASQCFQCHGTNGQSVSSIDSIGGKNANELFNELREMQAKTELEVMNQQAKVYTLDELRQIADYLATLPSAK